MREDIEKTGFVVYAGMSETKHPVAVFSAKTDAEWLSDFIDSSFPVEKIEVSELSGMVIDQYVGKIRAGLVPYNVNMYTDGSILFDVDDPVCYVAEPGIAETSDGNGISGTFWANDVQEAQNLAEQFRLRMINEGKL